MRKRERGRARCRWQEEEKKREYSDMEEIEEGLEEAETPKEIKKEKE